MCISFGLSTLIVLWGPYNKEHITCPVYMFSQGWYIMLMVPRVRNGGLSIENNCNIHLTSG